MERRLAAILAADVVGYSRLIRLDEEGTLADLKALRQELITPKVTEHHGRIVKLMGDGMLVEFPSVVDAVRVAVEIQKAMADRIANIPPGLRIMFRIGVNLGDVVIDGDDIHGDGVNIAARLEALAEPGGICVSGNVYEEVRDRTDFAFEDWGEQAVKNINRPVRVWSWTADASATDSDIPRRRAGSEIPSIAVLPFNDLSRRPEVDALADGLTEDIITALSRTRWFDVTARNSTFAYKGQSPNIRAVASALNVRYVLEGSVRGAGNQVRITVQLIDADSGNNVWADRFDRSFDDLFALQDEIAHRLASLITELVWQDVAKKIVGLAPSDYGPQEYTMAGIELLHRLTPAEVHSSEQHFLTAINMDPNLPFAHIALGLAHTLQWLFWDDPERSLLVEAAEQAAIAHDIAPDNAQTYRLKCRLALATGAFDEAKRHAERGLKINPGDSDIVVAMANYETFAGNPTVGLRMFQEILHVHSETPHSADIIRMWMSINQFILDDPAEARLTLNEISGLTYIRNLLLAACQAALGEIEAAQKSLKSARAEVPGITLSRLGLLRCFRRPEDGQKLQKALRMAGLPEQ